MAVLLIFSSKIQFLIEKMAVVTVEVEVGLCSGVPGPFIKNKTIFVLFQKRPVRHKVKRSESNIIKKKN